MKLPQGQRVNANPQGKAACSAQEPDPPEQGSALMPPWLPAFLPAAPYLLMMPFIWISLSSCCLRSRSSLSSSLAWYSSISFCVVSSWHLKRVSYSSSFLLEMRSLSCSTTRSCWYYSTQGQTQEEKTHVACYLVGLCPCQGFPIARSRPCPCIRLAANPCQITPCADTSSSVFSVLC